MRSNALPRWCVSVLPSLVALVVALLVGAGLMLIAGSNPLHAYQALLSGAFGSWYSLSEVAVKACPLLLTGLAVTIAFQAGVWNIGVEGQLLLGALVMTVLGSQVTAVPAVVGLPLYLSAAAGAGALWAGIAGVLKTTRNVNEILSTIMLNFIALHLLGYLVHGPLMEVSGQYPQTDPIAAHLLLPRLMPPYRLHIGLCLAVLMALVLHFGLYRTVWGYELRAIGQNPDAARLAGVAVTQRMVMALLLSGALAGVAGAVEVSGITRRMYEHFSPGWGFTAIAVALLGRLSPAGVVCAALFFGALDAGSNAMQRQAGVSSVLVSVIQGTVILCLIAFGQQQWWTRPAVMEDLPCGEQE